MNMNPNTAAVTLRWKVRDGEGGQQEVTDVETEPVSEPNDWHVFDFCRANNITLVFGEYALRVQIAQPIEVVSLPIEMGDEGRAALLAIFERPLANAAYKLAGTMAACPDEQATGELAERLLRTALIAFSKVAPGEDGAPVFQDLVDLHPGFLKVEHVSCVACEGGRVEDLDRGFTMDNAVAYVQASGTTATARVGFVGCMNPFAEALNIAFAEQLARAVKAAESRVVAEYVVVNETFAVGLLKSAGQIRAAFPDMSFE